jgi:hypothetical protein
MANIPSLYDAIGWRTPGGMPADASVGILPQIEPQKNLSQKGHLNDAESNFYVH